MHIKIYFNEKPLFLCDQIDSEIEPYVHHDDAVFIDELNMHTVKSMIHEMQQDKIHAGVFVHPNLEELRHDFFKKFTIIKAGGGLVTNTNDEALMIFRRGKWDLPKGKLDDGETIEECALREVEEETGLKDITLDSPLLITYHTYHAGTKFILKESHWFKMHIKAQQELIPQSEEDIQQAIWVSKTDIQKYKKDCFPSVVDVLEAGLTE